MIQRFMRKLLLMRDDKLFSFSSLTTNVQFRSIKFLPLRSVTEQTDQRRAFEWALLSLRG